MWKNIQKNNVNDDLFIDNSYGMDDISVEIYSIPKNMYKIFKKKIEEYLNKMKANKIVDRYEIAYYLK